MRKIITLLILVLIISKTKANIQINPSIRVGYLLSSKWSFGVDFDILYYQNKTYNLQYGLNFSQNYAKVKIRNIDKGFHSIFQLKGVIKNQFIAVRYGRGKVVNNWGWDNRSKCLTKGFAAELSFTNPNSYLTPWFGINIQRKQWDWEWFYINYYNFFTKLSIPTSKTKCDLFTKEAKEIHTKIRD